MNEDIASLQAAIDSMRIELTEAYEEISDLRFRLECSTGELENALSRERTLLRDQEDYRIGADNLATERDEAYEQLDRYKNGYEGGCHACEIVAVRNQELLAERDEARREICNRTSYPDRTPETEAKMRGWDCHKEDGK